MVEETSKRLSDLQTARDILAGRAEATTSQLTELQERNTKQLEDLQILLDQTKEELEAAEAKVVLSFYLYMNLITSILSNYLNSILTYIHTIYM